MSQQPSQQAHTPTLEGVDGLDASTDDDGHTGHTRPQVAETRYDVHMDDNETPAAVTPRPLSHSPAKTKTPSPNNTAVRSSAHTRPSLLHSPISPDLSFASATHPAIHIDRDNVIPKRPAVPPQNRLWQHRHGPLPEDDGPPIAVQPRPPLPSLASLPPLTAPAPDDIAVQTLGIPSSSFALSHDPRGFTFGHEDLTRFRMGGFVKCDVEGPVAPDDLKRMTVNEGVWRMWEEVGGLAKGAGGLFRFAFDKHGNEYRPEMTHVQVIRLVIAASPRRMMTLAQIYQAIEERWPWHKTAGSTWKNSIRHNLSLNDCFVNAERPCHEGGSGKGGYWMVNDKLSGKTARKLKRSALPDESTDTSNCNLFTADALPQKKRHRSTAPAHVYPSYASDQDYTDTSHFSAPLLPGVFPGHPGHPAYPTLPTHPAQGGSPRPSRRTKSSAPPALSSRTIARPATERPSLPPANNHFPGVGVHDADIPAHSETWQPDELIRSRTRASRRRPNWDRPLDGAMPPGNHSLSRSPPRSASFSPPPPPPPLPPAARNTPAVPAGAPGDLEVWTRSHPRMRMETRSSKHYDHPPPSPYPTPNTAGARSGRLSRFFARSVSPFGIGGGGGGGAGSTSLAAGAGAGAGASAGEGTAAEGEAGGRREPELLPSIATVLHEAFDNGRDKAQAKRKGKGKGKGKEKQKKETVGAAEREKEREWERRRMDNMVVVGEGVARGAGGVELLALAAEEMGM